MKAGGKPSTWLPPEGLRKQKIILSCSNDSKINNTRELLLLLKFHALTDKEQIHYYKTLVIIQKSPIKIKKKLHIHT